MTDKVDVEALYEKIIDREELCRGATSVELAAEYRANRLDSLRGNAVPIEMLKAQAEGW